LTNLNVIIIGAPRSGTNMLRDILVQFNGFSSWPCDEINYIWRHGNSRFSSDELPIELANELSRRYINKQFLKIRRKYNANVVVEKTCANSLRIPFVNSIIPDAKYIFIYRDGIDVIGSASLRWRAKLDFKYLIKKIKFIPLVDIPYYSSRYISSRLYKIFSKDKRLSVWGPKINDMNNLFKNYNLNEVCALQWQRCMNLTEEGLLSIPNENVFRIRYEDFVKNPSQSIIKIMKFLNKDIPMEILQASVSKVSRENIGKGRKALGDHQVSNLQTLIKPTLKRYEYL